MTVDNPRVRARNELEELGLSRESASYVVDGRPMGGWESFATKDDLRVLAAELRAEVATLGGDLRVEIERGFKAQTWRLMTALIATVTLMSVILRVV